MSSEDPRPPKRARKKTVSETPPTAPVDHVFIAEGATKKSPAKKPPLSCAECRRLKLRCDRTFPCHSCTKRGCANICPEGVLVSGKGTRFILANTEQLHLKIGDMSDRIRTLEDAVRAFQLSSSPDPHPLLSSHLLAIKSTLALYNESQTGSLHDGAHMGQEPQQPGPRVPSPQHSDVAQIDGNTGNSRQDTARDAHDQVHDEILRLSNDFLFSNSISTKDSLRSRLRDNLPPRAHTTHLWEQVQRHATWQYNPHPNSTFMPNLIHHVYDSPLEDLCSRRLALLFMIVAVGCVVDTSQPSNPEAAEQFHQLARAALCEQSVLENTTADAILVLFYMIWYLLEFSVSTNAAGYAWALMGLTAKLAQSIGLHRDALRSKVIPEEVERRRALFWELLHLDARLSLSLGRPPSLFLSHSDCPRPTYLPDEGFSSSDSQHHYQEWRHSCFVHCLHPSLEVISSPTPDYATVVEIDRKIRDFYIPPIFQDSGRTFSRPLTMQKASLSMAVEAVLLQLHRSFFTHALCGPEGALDCESKYAPSLVAVVLGASRMIAAMDWLYHRDPELSVRMVRCWTNTFSAAAALSLLVSRAPFTCLCPAVLQELERVRCMFTSARDQCPQVAQVLPVLERMIDKANHIYVQWATSPEEATHVSHNRANATSEATGQDLPHRQSSGKDSEVLKESQPKEAFQRTHPDLMQCVVEVHQRAQVLFPMRKNCRCGPMAIPHPPAKTMRSTVLPELYTERFAYGVLGSGGIPTIGPLTAAIVPESRIAAAAADVPNFDFGALDSSWNDQGWMTWF